MHGSTWLQLRRSTMIGMLLGLLMALLLAAPSTQAEPADPVTNHCTDWPQRMFVSPNTLATQSSKYGIIVAYVRLRYLEGDRDAPRATVDRYAGRNWPTDPVWPVAVADPCTTSLSNRWPGTTYLWECE